MNARRLLSVAAKTALFLIISYFVGKTILANREQVSAYAWDFDPALMGLSLLAFFGAYAFLAWTWGKVLRYAGHPISFKDAWEIYFIGNLGHYIPGKVWTVAGVAYMAERKGIPPMAAGAAVVFAQAYSIISSLAFFPAFLILSAGESSWLRLEWAIPAILAFVGIFMFPGNLERMLNRVLAFMGKERISLDLTPGKAVRITVLYTISWGMFGAAFWLFVSAVTRDGTVSPVLLTAVYALSYVAGYLAFFAPGGLGVREGAASCLLSSAMSPGVAVLVTFLVRLPSTLVEIFCVLLILLRKGFSYVKSETAAGKRS